VARCVLLCQVFVARCTTDPVEALARPCTKSSTCAACTTPAHAPCRICDDNARWSTARLVRTDSAHHSFQRRAMTFRRNAATLPFHRAPQPDSFTRLRVRNRRGRRKHSARQNHQEQRNNKTRMCVFLCARNGPTSMLSARTEHATHLRQQRAQSHKPASLQVGCPRRVLLSPAFPCTHCHAIAFRTQTKQRDVNVHARASGTRSQ